MLWSMSEISIPRTCPACGDTLQVERLRCEACATRVEGAYRLPRLARMSPSSRELVELLVLSSGSLKALAERLGVSYPTIRKRLDGVIEELEGEIQADERYRRETLRRVADDEESAEEAARRIRQT